MLLSGTYRNTGPPPPGLVPVGGGTITVPEPTRAATPPIKAPITAPARKPDALPEISQTTYVPQVSRTSIVQKPSAPPQPAGGASAFAAQMIASGDTVDLSPPEALVVAKPEPEVTLRRPPPAEPLTQRTQLQLSNEELEIVRQLAARDRDVRAHEQAHVAAATGIAGSPRYTYVTGPDAQRYAVAGEVQIDNNSEPGSPEATIAKMEQVKKAALAPAQPSAQDKSVAAAAEAAIREAQADIRARERDEEEQAILKTEAKEQARENNQAVTPATVQQANLAFSQAPATSAFTGFSLEGLFA